MRRLRILVVDDEPAIVKFLRANLEANGFGVAQKLNKIGTCANLHTRYSRSWNWGTMFKAVVSYKFCVTRWKKFYPGI